MKNYLLYMLIAATIGAFLAELCKLIINLLGKEKLSFGGRIKKLFRKDAMPLGAATVLTTLTIMAHTATYAGSSVYAGYDLATLKAVPFFVLLVMDIIFVISEIIGFMEDKITRKSRAVGIIAGVILGIIVAALTLKICISLGCRMPWYGG